MALDVASLTLNDDDSVINDSQASLASMPEELSRKIASYLRPATTARAFVVASGRSTSLQRALRAEIEQTERELFGATRRTPTTRGPPARRQTTRRAVSRPSRGHLCK